MVIHLSKEAEKELPPQKTGVGVGMKYTMIPFGDAGYFTSVYTKACAPFKQRALVSAVLASLLKTTALTIVANTSAMITFLDMFMFYLD
jgi:hypothetical protein